MPASTTKRLPLRALARYLALLALPVTAWLACTDLWLPSRTSRISLWYGTPTFDQCFAALSEPGGVFWMPSAAQIREAEAGLAPMFAARKQKGLTVPPGPGAGEPFRFHHEYIGFVKQGERVIYINAYPFYDNDEANLTEFSLLDKPMCVADGGKYFWGIVYHPRSKSFEEPAFNGPG